MNLTRDYSGFVQRSPAENALTICTAKHSFPLSFDEVETRSRGFDAQFAAAGFAPGDAFLIYMRPGRDILCLMLAAFRSGLVPCVLESKRHWNWLQKNYPCPFKAIICDRVTFLVSILWKFPPGIKKICLPASVHASRRAGFKRESTDFVEVEKEAPALLSFSSSNSGDIKLVARSAGVLAAQSKLLLKYLNVRPGKTYFTEFPFISMALISGGARVCFPAFQFRKRSIQQWVDMLRMQKPEALVLSPGLLALFQAYPHSLTFESVLEIYCGGGPVFSDLIMTAQRIFPWARFFVVYGATEAEPICVKEFNVDPDAQITPGLPVGIPVAEVDVAVLPLPQQAVRPSLESGSPDEVAGEILVKGEHVALSGTIKGASVVNHAGDVWLATGDYGFLNRHGELYLLGRCNDIIFYQDKYIYPWAVEAKARKIPAVARAIPVVWKDNLVLLCEVPSMRDEFSKEDIHRLSQLGDFDRVMMTKFLPKDRRHHWKINSSQLVKYLKGSKMIWSRSKLKC